LDSLADSVEFFGRVAATGLDDLATLEDEAAVLAEVAVGAPAAARIEVVRVSHSPGAHFVITLSRAFRYER
jgi:hypothetical protein